MGWPNAYFRGRDTRHYELSFCLLIISWPAQLRSTLIQLSVMSGIPIINAVRRKAELLNFPTSDENPSKLTLQPTETVSIRRRIRKESGELLEIHKPIEDTCYHSAAAASPIRLPFSDATSGPSHSSNDSICLSPDDKWSE